MKSSLSLVDRLGAINDQMSTLKSEADAIKQTLISSGVGEYNGDLFKALVTAYTRETLSVDACREKLEKCGVSKQWFVAHTKLTPITSVTVSARGPLKVLAGLAAALGSAKQKVAAE